MKGLVLHRCKHGSMLGLVRTRARFEDNSGYTWHDSLPLDSSCLFCRYSHTAAAAKLAHQNAINWRREKRRIRKGAFLDWIYRVVPIPKLKNKTGHFPTPRFGLGP